MLPFTKFLIVAAFATVAFLSQSAVDYYRLAAVDKATPWFDERWYISPYIHLMARLHEPREYWKTNAEGSERWRVYEFTAGTATFWTVLERHPVASEASPSA